MVSLRQFAATFLRDCAPRWKPSTIEGHRHDLNGLILPTLGDLAVDVISRADVTAWRDRLDVAGRSKDRATSVLSSLIRHAEMLGLRPAGANPCAGQRRHRSDFKARYLSAPDYRRFGLALDRAAEADPIEVAYIRFLMLTGARRGEAMNLEWSMIQTDRATLPDSKTGPKCLWFATPVRQLLAGLDRVKGSPFVFVRPCGRGIASSLDRVWRGVRKAARLNGLLLSDKVAAAAMPGRREYNLRDTRLAGLALRVLPTGGKSWVLRLQVDGRPRRVTLAMPASCRSKRHAARPTHGSPATGTIRCRRRPRA